MQLNLVFSWSSMPLDDKNCTVCHSKNVENHILFVMQKMLLITLLLWKDFGQKLLLAEGLWSISCLEIAVPDYGFKSLLIIKKFQMIMYQNLVWIKIVKDLLKHKVILFIKLCIMSVQKKKKYVAILSAYYFWIRLK